VSRRRNARPETPAVRLVPLPAGAAPGSQAEHPARWRRPRLRTLVVASGKGGVGKSNLAANLALALGERGARVLLVDGDVAQANLDLLLGVHPRFDLQHVLAGQKTVDEIIVSAPHGVKLVPAASGVPELADLDDIRRETLLRAIGSFETEADLLVVDTASGVGRLTTEFCRMAHDLLVVTTPEMPAFSDAYALVKLLQQQGGLARAPHLVVNMATGAEEADDTAHRLQLVARRFLRLELDCAGVVPWDVSVTRAARSQEPVLSAFPRSPAAAAYRALANRFWKPLSSGPTPVEEPAPSQQRLEA